VSGAAARSRSVARAAAGWFAAVYLVVLALIAYWPTPVDRGARGTIADTLAWLHAHGVPGWLDYRLIEFSANVALFVPVGLFTVMLLGRSRWWLAVLAGLTVSTVIELGQLVLLPHRFATVVDVAANTVGATLGAALSVALLHALTARAAERARPTA
jgi:hypothetical protein